jgi:FkbM family methyltransferase
MNLPLRKLLILLKKWLMPLRIEYGLRQRKHPIIIEVGANDGKTGDPLYRLIKQSTTGRVLLIEPVRHLFMQLKQTYSDCNHCIFENVAIGSVSGLMPIFFIRSDARDALPYLPPYFEELASFERKKLSNLLGEKGQEFLCEESVETTSLSTLLLKHNIDKVDLLQIDTEGYDFEVLKTFPFDFMRPVIVIFEHSHLDETDRTASVRMMAKNRYKVERWGKDFVCVAQ